MGESHSQGGEYPNSINPFTFRSEPQLMNKLIYLATPYSHPEASIRHERYEKALSTLSALIMNEFHVYSPIVMCHPVEVLQEVKLDWHYWADFDKLMIERSDLIVVVKIEGHEKSIGIAAELQHAEDKGIQYIHIEYPISEIDIERIKNAISTNASSN